MKPASINNDLEFLSLIKSELVMVRDHIDAQLESLHAHVNHLVDHVKTGSGKMLRPALVLLSGLACGEISKQHITIAAIVEMVHCATLLHDDVIDEADTRRGQPTINKLFDNETAILAGDLLLSRASLMCSDLPSQINKIVARTTAQVCEGELSQLLQKDNFQLTQQQYIEIINQKTAALFQGCCELAAISSHADDSYTHALSCFGNNIGIAFQITDDLIDITGNECQTGKTSGRDIDKNKLTLPLIHAISSVEPEQIEQFTDQIEIARDNKKQLIAILNKTNSIEYSRQYANKFVTSAIDSLSPLPNTPAKDSLLAMANFVTNRIA